jgi:hypothetical protein
MIVSLLVQIGVLFLVFALGLLLSLTFAGLRSCGFSFHKESLPDSSIVKKDNVPNKIKTTHIKKTEIKEDSVKANIINPISPKKPSLVDKVMDKTDAPPPPNDTELTLSTGSNDNVTEAK